jgi:hypothetical protein
MVGHVLQSMNEVVSNSYTQNHQAIDIVSSDHQETDIIALDSGNVQAVVSNIKGTNHKSKGLATYGNYVQVKQNDGKTALYAHMKYGSVRVNEGENIDKGEKLGTIGETGNAYGTHLHLEIKNQNNVKENPIISLNTTQNTNETQNTQETKNENIPKNESINNQSIPQTNTDINIKQDTQVSQQNIQPTQTNSQPITSQKTVNQFLSNPKYHYGSIVDALKNINIDSSYQNRKILAQINGITNYHGSYSQNVKLLSLLKEGKLKNIS